MLTGIKCYFVYAQNVRLVFWHGLGNVRENVSASV